MRVQHDCKSNNITKLMLVKENGTKLDLLRGDYRIFTGSAVNYTDASNLISLDNAVYITETDVLNQETITLVGKIHNNKEFSVHRFVNECAIVTWLEYTKNGNTYRRFYKYGNQTNAILKQEYDKDPYTLTLNFTSRWLKYSDEIVILNPEDDENSARYNEDNYNDETTPIVYGRLPGEASGEAEHLYIGDRNGYITLIGVGIGTPVKIYINGIIIDYEANVPTGAIFKYNNIPLQYACTINGIDSIVNMSNNKPNFEVYLKRGKNVVKVEGLNDIRIRFVESLNIV